MTVGFAEWIIILLMVLVGLPVMLTVMGLAIAAIVRRPRLVLIPLAVVGVVAVLAVVGLFTARVSVHQDIISGSEATVSEVPLGPGSRSQLLATSDYKRTLKHTLVERAHEELIDSVNRGLPPDAMVGPPAFPQPSQPPTEIDLGMGPGVVAMKGGISMIALLLLLGLAALVVYLVVLAFRRPRIAAIVLASCVALVVVGSLLAVLLPVIARARPQARTTQAQLEAQTHIQSAPPATALIPQPSGVGAQPGLAVWDPDVTRRFLADKYPSDRSAAIGLTHHWIGLWKERAGPGAVPARVTLCGDVPTDVLTAMDGVVRTEWPGVAVHFSPGTNAAAHVERTAETAPAESAPSPPTIVLEAQILSERTSHTRSGYSGVSRSGPPLVVQAQAVELERAGSLRVGLTSSVTNGSVLTEWVDKPWIEDLPAYRSSLAALGERGDLLVGYSSGLAATPADAQREAMASAAEVLRTELAKRVPGAALPDPAALEVSAQRATRDMFVQQLRRPYGDVYRAAVLVDLSTDALASQRLDNVKGTLARAVGLLLLTVLVYLFLNAATKGYYVWSVRLVAVAVAVVGLGWVLMWA